MVKGTVSRDDFCSEFFSSLELEPLSNGLKYHTINARFFKKVYADLEEKVSQKMPFIILFVSFTKKIGGKNLLGIVSFRYLGS